MADELKKKLAMVSDSLGLLEKYKEDYTTNPKLADQVGAWAKQLEAMYDRFYGFSAKLEMLSTDAEVDKLKEDRLAFDARYYTMLAFCLNKSTPSGAAPSLPASSASSSSQTLRTKLPELILPKFNGELKHWCEFRDAFKSAIGSRDDISGVDKVRYLKGLMEGEAKLYLNNVEISEQGYKDAMRKLYLRYENNRQLIKCHIETLFDTPAMSRESADELLLLIDRFEQQLSVLKSLGEPADKWSSLLVYQLSIRLDQRTLREWESYCTKLDSENVASVLGGIVKPAENSDEKTVTPSYVTMINYLQNYARVLTAAPATSPPPPSLSRSKPKPSKSVAYTATAAAKPESSSTTAASSSGKTSKPCVKCGQEHHLYHCPGFHQLNSTSGTPQYALVSHDRAAVLETVFLPTALVNIRDCRGRTQVARCLLDCASQRNFITEALCQKLQLPRVRLPDAISICGIGNSSASVKHKTTVTVHSRVSSFALNSSMLVLPTITVKLPQSTVDVGQWAIPQHVELADPNFAVPGSIDMILGASHFFRILRNGRVKLGENLPLLQNTKFGWVISGDCLREGHDHVNPRDCQFSNPCTIEELVSRFWELEEVQDNKGWSPLERYCEDHFLQHTTRDPDGRYVVKLPKREEMVPLLKDNRFNATRRFYSLEHSLERDPEKKAQYHRFIAEYLQLGHMREVAPEEVDAQPQYFLPHHAVMKPDSTTTKLRTVFDASCRSKSGLSLNDVLLPGPTIQDTLVKIVMRFRYHQFVVCADIEKMFRQILVHPSDQPLQRILWRDDPALPLKELQLLTVTYGTNSAPFLSTRVLQQLADDEEHQFPLAAQALRRDFYVDNLLSGSDDESALTASCKHQAVLAAIPPELHEKSAIRDLDHEASVTTLGLRWEPNTDFLLFKPPHWKESPVLTKRVIASQVSSMFDPLGFVCPTITKAKIKLQALWRMQIDWDAPVPEAVVRDWMEFKQRLTGFDRLRIPRHVIRPGSKRLELHGFCDASENAFGACIYLRSISEDKKCTVRLLTAKSKVAPININTIPRLELCGARLLAKLLCQVLESYAIDAPVYLWTDSTIVLNWISGSPVMWGTFVANRVAEIQERTALATWNHVPSGDNPADLVSRGMDLDELMESALWWHGPQWLGIDQHPWPQIYVPNANVEEERRRVVSLPAVEDQQDIINRYSNLRHLIRIGALLRRFCENCLRHKNGQLKLVGPLTLDELDRTQLDLIRRVQQQYFEEDFRLLSTTGRAHRKSKLRFLHPQLVNGIIRVGGRLHNARIPVDVKHPIVLPAKHRLTEMITRREHLRTLHAGPGLLLSTLRQRFWPLGGRNLVRSIVHRCMTCARAKPSTLQQLMGNLPSVRVNQAHPFENVGVDLAGPIYICSSLRNHRNPIIKAYIVVYVCLATKAVHLDLVTDLTTDAFIACLRRFCGRRGLPANVYCDNGTNFVGAHKELEDLRKLFLTQRHQDAVARDCADSGIHFHFIPPRSPTFGGIWEACVKSVKHLLRRVVGDAHLLESEMQTVLIQIEGQLNSRPIVPLPASPSDEMALTPGHFLVGRPLNAIPDPDQQAIPENRLSRWRRVQQLAQHFWSRWHKEYLATLQNRYRWNTELDNLAVGSVVALMDERYPPQKWLLGRVLDVHPGADGLVRVATVKTSTGTTQRAINKLCLLPVEIDPASIATQQQSPVERSPGPSSGNRAAGSDAGAYSNIQPFILLASHHTSRRMTRTKHQPGLPINPQLFEEHL
ncbi:uncharacterized protein LOC119766512 [Culex quinquefasciatus]|uniref:uncharacterized protein LOC119766512 n=1 Tax=Culex quinquefasciatus TaxID=7176 RepID=UPI0018E371DE|nr:uncharacterized protein LOC119766512 [Culex quinquefasciatus]